MNTLEYCDLLMKEKELKSTYALAKFLQVGQTTAQQWRKLNYTFSDETALRVAKELNLPSEKILLDMQIERCKSQSVKSVWKNIASTFPSTLIIMTVFNYILCKIFDVNNDTEIFV